MEHVLASVADALWPATPPPTPNAGHDDLVRYYEMPGSAYTEAIKQASRLSAFKSVLCGVKA